MLAAVKTSLFCPKNVGFLKSKLGQAADMKQTIGCSKTCEFIKANKTNI